MMQPRDENRRPVVLLVEDEPGDQELTRRGLEGGVDVDLRVVDDGGKAMDYLMRRGSFASSDEDSVPMPDLILLDWNLPGQDGREVLETIRRTPSIENLVVVVLTNSQHESDVRHAYALRCNSYVVKPVDVDAFGKLLRELATYWFDFVQLPPSVSVN